MHKNKAFDSLLQEQLDDRKSKNLYRNLTLSNSKIDFSSNDYLGFAKLPALKTKIDHALEAGSTGSRLISGNSIEAEKTEEMIARFHHAEAALLFNCGYMANVGLFSSIANKGDTIISDAYIHASIIDGIRLSLATKYKFRHNDIADLEQKLKHASGNKFVVVESLYSMDGDEAPLEQIAELCDRYQALLLVDEAHATGVFGNNGEGLVSKYKLQDKVYACIFTYGKALGLHGAAVTGSHTLRNYLINFSRPFIYSTALPPHACQQIQIAYQLLPRTNRQPLFDLIDYFRNSVKALGEYSFVESQSQIQGIIIGDNTKTKNLSDYLFQKGIYAKAILSPTVPVGTERLRICLHSYNTTSQVDVLLVEIKTFLK